MCEHTFSPVNDDVGLDELPTPNKIVIAEKSHVRLQVVHAQNSKVASGGENALEAFGIA